MWAGSVAVVGVIRMSTKVSGPARRARTAPRGDDGGRAARGLLVVLGHLGQAAERVGVADREVGQDLPVNLHPALLEPGHEPAVAQAMDPGGGIDPGDPERPKL